MRKLALSLTVASVFALWAPVSAEAVTSCYDQYPTVSNLRVLRTSCVRGRSVVQRWIVAMQRGGTPHRQFIAPFTCFNRWYGGGLGATVTCRASLGRWVWFAWGD